MQWLRLYHDTAHDPKWRVVAVESEQPLATVLGVWTYMLIFASQAKTRGTLEGWNDRVAGAALDIKGDRMTAIREAMQGVVLDGDKLTGWDRRQRNSDNVAERVRKHREANRPVTPDNDPNGVTSENVTERNENVTLPKNDVTLHNLSVTENPLRAQTQIQITEEEKEESPLPPAGGGVPDLFSEEPASGAKLTRKQRTEKVAGQYAEALERFKETYPRRNHPHNWYGNAGAEKKFIQAVESGTDPELIISAAGRYAQQAKKDGIFGTSKVADALTWMNGKRWIGWNNVHELRPNDDFKFDGDKNNPPVGYDDAPTGTRKGWWCKTSRGWNRYAS